MARIQRKEPSLWPKMLMLILLCIVVGGAAGYWVGGDPGFFKPTRLWTLLAGGSAAPREESAPKAETVSDKYCAMSRLALEQETRRLARALEAKDREIGDLTIKLKLATAGSRTR